MKPLSVLVATAGIAASYVAAAPMGVIIVSGPGPTFDRDSDALRPYRLTNEFRRPPPSAVEIHEMPVVWGMPGPRIQVHPATENGEKHKACGLRKGKGITMECDAAVACRMRVMMNKLRAALGLPLVEYHHRVSLTDGAPVPGSALRHHHHQHQQNGEHIVFGVPAQKKEPFDIRLGRALNALGTWEARAVTFVLGVGLGALVRMLAVFVILAFRARRGERCMSRCALRRAARREAEEAAIVAAGLGPVAADAPPAYDGSVKFEDEKLAEKAAVEASTAVSTVDETKAADGDLMENVHFIETIDYVDGELVVYWTHVNGEDKQSPAVDFHKKNPQKLLAFYESNLKWRPAPAVDEEEENADSDKE